jgi:uncharacterized protein YacL
MLFQESDFDLTKEQERWIVGIMLSVTLVKLVLMIYCRSFTDEIVKAYAQDHFFDVITNTIGLVAALLANYLEDWMDPVGAIVVSDCTPSLPCLFLLFSALLWHQGSSILFEFCTSSLHSSYLEWLNPSTVFLVLALQTES